MPATTATKKPKLNRRAIRTVIKAIENIDKQGLAFNMKVFGETNVRAFKKAGATRFTPECGTAACVAGFTMGIFKVNGERRISDNIGRNLLKYQEHSNAKIGMDAAAKILGLDNIDRDLLFTPNDYEWHPERFTPRRAIRTLQYLLKTGKVSWDARTHTKALGPIMP